MAKYLVELEWIERMTVTVEADSPEEAENMVYNEEVDYDTSDAEYAKGTTEVICVELLED